MLRKRTIVLLSPLLLECVVTLSVLSSWPTTKKLSFLASNLWLDLGANLGLLEDLKPTKRLSTSPPIGVAKLSGQIVRTR